MITNGLRKKCCTNTLVTNIINTVFALAALISAGLIAKSLSMITSNIKLQGTYDAESYIDGYLFLADLFGSGISVLFDIILGVLLIILIIGFVLFFLSDIIGWVTFYKLRKENDIVKAKGKIKLDSIVKIIIAGIMIAVSIIFLTEGISFIFIVILVMQSLVGILAIINLRQVSGEADYAEV